MEKFTGKTYEEYKEYAKKRRSKSIICSVYEDLEVEEIVKKLVNKDWKTFYNVKHNKNKPNYMFLKQMKQRLIKTLVYNKIIYKRKNGTYEEYKYYGLLE